MLGWEPYQAESWFDYRDLSRGMEPIPVPVAYSNVTLAPFHYMSSSMVHGKARLDRSLYPIRPGDSCKCGPRDCLTAPVPCECATESGGEFAYGEDGLLRDCYLQQGISDCSSCKIPGGCYCLDVPRVDARGRGKASPIQRTFIRECSVKCGCHQKCGNRVVQQGMKYQIEVFHTGERGWGIRATKAIPRGAFVFELSGEIVTNAEMDVRNFAVWKGPSYGLQLDADWATEKILDDNSALCLDSTFFGNVARFLNHRFVMCVYIQ